MEPVSAIILISIVIIAITQLIKYLAPNINGAVTIVVAVVVGILIALIDQFIGATDITIAEGVLAGLGAVGITTAASKVNTVTK